MEPTQRYGMTIPLETIPLGEHRPVIEELESLGYTDVWSAEADGVDGFTPLVLSSQWAPSLRLGCAIFPAYTRGPALMAQSAAGLAAAAPGRAVIGIGSSSNVIVERWNGIPFADPYKRTRDMVRFLRDALTGEKVTATYDTFEIKGFRLRAVPPEQPKILVAALRSGMLRMAGREADGAIINWLSADDVAKVVPHVRDAAGGGDRKEIVARIFVCPSDDAETVRSFGRFLIAAYLTVPVYRAFHEWLGRAPALQAMWDAWAAGDRQGALAVIPDEIVDDLIIWGTPDQCRAHIQRYIDNGVDTPALAVLPFGIDMGQAIKDLAPKFIEVRRWGVVCVLALVGALVPLSGRAADTAPSCGLDGTVTALATGTAEPSDARTYRMLPFEVPAGATTINVSYRWTNPSPSTPLTQNVFDLGLWEGAEPAGDGARFRGWSGSRAANITISPSATTTTRGYVPGPITAGRWWVELGIAAIGAGGSDWEVFVQCSSADPGPAFVPQPVATDHVANSSPGWYEGDFHLHGRHSNPCAPEWTSASTLACAAAFPSIHDQARGAGLDFAAVTDYVTTAHWDELGAAQAETPQFLWWPSREVITYFGHATVFGETRGVVDHRHGLTTESGAVTMHSIQAAAKGAGALFGVAHPTLFPGPAFRNFCRGCEWELASDVDWANVDTIEVHTGPGLADLSDAGGPATHQHGLSAQQPFTFTAVDYWEDLLLAGFKIAPVSGSDSKGVEPSEAERIRRGYGSSSTSIYAQQLSVAALREAIAAGHLYVRVRGPQRSPELGVSVQPTGAEGPGHPSYTFGDEVPAGTAWMDVTVTGGAGQLLQVSRNGTPVATIPVTSDAFQQRIAIFRAPGEEVATSALGTFWRVDTLDSRGLTAIGNAVFLQG